MVLLQKDSLVGDGKNFDLLLVWEGWVLGGESDLEGHLLVVGEVVEVVRCLLDLAD